MRKILLVPVAVFMLSVSPEPSSPQRTIVPVVKESKIDTLQFKATELESLIKKL